MLDPRIALSNTKVCECIAGTETTMDDSGHGYRRDKRAPIIVYQPNPSDVLMGRGRTHKHHPGNQRFQGT
jgi:hypothetical protein